MQRHRQRGFTLVELLIAIAVFAVMAGIAYSGLSSVINSRETINAALDRSKHLQMALWRIQQDIEQTVDRPVRNRYGDREPAVYGSPTLGLYVTRAGWANPLGEPRSTLQRVHYQLDGDRHLERAYFRVLDQAQDSEPVVTDLLDGVTAVEWRYLDSNNQWQDRWPPDTGNGTSTDRRTPGLTSDDQASAAPLPKAIELRLDTESRGRLRLLFAIAGAEP